MIVGKDEEDPCSASTSRWAGQSSGKWRRSCTATTQLRSSDINSWYLVSYWRSWLFENPDHCVAVFRWIPRRGIRFLFWPRAARGSSSRDAAQQPWASAEAVTPRQHRLLLTPCRIANPATMDWQFGGHAGEFARRRFCVSLQRPWSCSWRPCATIGDVLRDFRCCLWKPRPRCALISLVVAVCSSTALAIVF